MPVNRLLISGAVLAVAVVAIIVAGAGLKLALREEPIKQPYHFESAKASYSFFVAGHTYGSPGDDNVGFYPPFKSGLNSINASRKMRFGVLTGDVVISGSEKNWNEIDDDWNSLLLGIFIFNMSGQQRIISKEMVCVVQSGWEYKEPKKGL